MPYIKSVLLTIGLLIVSLNAFAKTNYQSFSLMIINHSGFNTPVPAHDIHYVSDWPQSLTYGPAEETLKAEGSEELELWRQDDASIATNLVITDPAAKNRVIFKAQVYYEPTDKRPVLFIRKSDENYIIIPYITSGNETYEAGVEIDVYDKSFEPLKTSLYHTKK